MTGAGSGIGRQTALAFAREGAEVVISDIDEASVKDTATKIAACGGNAHTYTLDVSDADAVERFAEQVCADHGVPDIVVNNAGVGHAGLFLDTPVEEFDRVLDVNLGFQPDNPRYLFPETFTYAPGAWESPVPSGALKSR